MSKSVIALVVTTLACGTASAYFWQELREERAQSEVLQARVAELEKTLATPLAVTADVQPFGPPSPEPAAAPEPKPAAAKPVVAALGSTGAPATIAFTGPNMRNGGRMDPEMQRRMQESFERQRAMLKDPEYRELMRAQQKMGMRRMYGDMESMLGLSKEEAENVMDVLAEQQVRSMEQRPPMGMEGTRDPAAFREQQRGLEDMTRQNEKDLAAALGSKYGEWQEYQQSFWSRSQVMRLKESLSGSNDPLRQDQIKPLVQALAREQQQMQINTARAQRTQFPNGPPSSEAQLRAQEEWLDRTTQSHERIRNAVSSLLSSSQMQELQQQQDQERKMQELNLRMQRARAEEMRARGEDPSAEAQFGLSTNAVIAR